MIKGLQTVCVYMGEEIVLMLLQQVAKYILLS